MYNPTTPPMTIKHIPAMIEKRISTNSCKEVEFARSSPIYNQALCKSGYKTELTFNPNPSDTKSSRHRKRNIIWFNPYLTIKLPPTLVKLFSTFYVNISSPTIGYTKSATKKISNLAIAAHLTWEIF